MRTESADWGNSCWDGKNLDTPNHMDHVAHPIDGPAPFAVVDGKCPDSHPVKIPQVHYEVCEPWSDSLPFFVVFR